MAAKVGIAKWTVFLTLLLFCAVAWGDVIYLNTGGIVKGKIVERNEDSIVIVTEQGNRTEIFLDDIERIEEGESVEEMYKEKLSKIKEGDADGHYQLAMWLKKVNYHEQAKEEFEKAIILDPNHEFARAELGYTKRKEGWVLPKEEREEPWVHGVKKSATRRRGRAVRKRKRTRFDRKLLDGLPGLLTEAADNLLDKDPEVRAQAYQTFAAVSDEELLAKVKMLMQAHCDRVLSSTEKGQRAILRLLKGQTSKSLHDMQVKWFERWEEARLDALQVVYDREIYPRENHGRVGQPIVNEKVGRLKKLWPYYDALVSAEVLPLRKLSAQDAVKLLNDYDKKLQLLKEVAEKVKAFGVQVEPYQDSVTDVYRCLLSHRAERYQTAFTLARRLDDWECRLWLRLESLRVRYYNERVVKTSATTEERKLVQLTNDYRMQMGRRPVEIDDRLVRSSRKHSEEMSRLGYFSHTSPVKERRTSGMRARLEGYPSGVSENIHCGSGNSAASSFRGWYNSSGHHRNMLGGGDPQNLNKRKGASKDSQEGRNFFWGGWRCMGCGKNGGNFTEQFGHLSALEKKSKKRY